MGNSMHVNGSTKIYGLLGYPVKHTFSPLMHNAAFNSLGLNAVYLPFEVKPEKLKTAIEAVKALGISGLNITVPHKEKVIKYLDIVDEEAALIKSVNTVVLENGKLKGFNTDGRGFIMSLKEEFGFSPCQKRFFILGAGGAARAIAFSLAFEGAEKIILVDALPKKAANLAKAVSNKTSCDAIALDKNKKAMKDRLLNCDVLINATPCGMKKDDPKVIEPELLYKNLFVYDIIYNPRQTTLLRDARNRGAKIANGIGMLINQGILSFGIWTKKSAPVHAIKTALRGLL
jgi:shikimate dehydrogenase